MRVRRLRLADYGFDAPWTRTWTRFYKHGSFSVTCTLSHIEALMCARSPKMILNKSDLPGRMVASLYTDVPVPGSQPNLADAFHPLQTPFFDMRNDHDAT